MLVLTWVAAVASLVGVWLNIRKHIACFWIWSVTNAVWVYVDLKHGIGAQAALQLAYFGLAVYGIAAWSRPKAGEEESCRN